MIRWTAGKAYVKKRKEYPILPPNGMRYAPHALCGVLVGGTRKRRFDGTNFKPRKLPENAATPTTTVLVLSQGSGARCVGRCFILSTNNFIEILDIPMTIYKFSKIESSTTIPTTRLDVRNECMVFP